MLDDVWDEYVSIDAALRDYGVVITGSLEEMTLAVDHEATTSGTEDPPMSDDVYRIGVDVGGTFTDCVLRRPDGSLALEKAPTTPQRPERGRAQRPGTARRRRGSDGR